MVKILLLCLLTFTSTVFANGMGAGLLGQDGTSLVPIRLDCYFHDPTTNIPLTWYESHVIYRAHEVDLCSKDADIIISSGIVPATPGGRQIAEDPGCYIHSTTPLN